jgi:phenylacetate-CoA ligase
MSDLYTRFIAKLVFPLQERVKKHDTVRVRRQMEESQWWSAERIAALQVERLKAFLTDIGANVPYYRELFASTGFDPRAVKSTGDLQALPFLTKAVIKEHTDALRADDAKGLARFNTGGSSGVPLIFLHRHRARQPRRGGQVARHALVERRHRRPEIVSGARPSNSALRTACA